MFDTLFHYPRVLARHCEGPAANERSLYLAKLGIPFTHVATHGPT
jgi:hypothetical protein